MIDEKPIKIFYRIRTINSPFFQVLERLFMENLNVEFMHVLQVEISHGQSDLMTLREYLVRYKSRGMNQNSMYKNLMELRNKSDLKTEELILDLMDFVIGFCNLDLSIF